MSEEKHREVLLARIGYMQNLIEEMKNNFERSKRQIRDSHQKELEIKDNALREAQEKALKLVKKVQRLELDNMNLKAEVKSVKKKMAIMRSEQPIKYNVESVIRKSEVESEARAASKADTVSVSSEGPQKSLILPLEMPEVPAETPHGAKWRMLSKNPMCYTLEYFTIMRERALNAIRDKEDRMVRIAFDIEKDIGRTLTTTKEFTLHTNNSIRLRQLLCTIAFTRPDLGYAQGMNMYAGMLLLNCRNLDAFIILNGLLCVPIIRAAFNGNMELLKAYATIFSNLLNDQASKIYKHLAKCAYPLETYIFDVAVCLFTNNLPLAVVAKIWDIVIENPELGIMRVGLSIFKALEKLILTKKQEEIMMLVKYPYQHVSEEVVMKTIIKTTIKQKDYDNLKEKVMRQAGVKQPILI